jgi:hypothetical protein
VQEVYDDETFVVVVLELETEEDQELAVQDCQSEGVRVKAVWYVLENS